MTTLTKIATLSLMLAAGTATHAMQNNAVTSATSTGAVKAGTSLATSDGKRLGRIKRVQTGVDGRPASVTVIYDDRFVNIPASTLSAADKGLVTSLSRAEVSRLN